MICLEQVVFLTVVIFSVVFGLILVLGAITAIYIGYEDKELPHE